MIIIHNITIFGAGNMGYVLAAKFSQHNNVCIYTNEFDSKILLSKSIKVICDDGQSYTGKIAKITKDMKEAVSFGDIIVITYPAFLFEKYAKLICPLLDSSKHLLFVPGSGGAELYFKEALDKGATVSGLQRVHSVARIIEPGKSVRESGVRKELFSCSIPNSFTNEGCKIIEELYGIPTKPLESYLNITLINSNPILHSSRLYTIFKDCAYKKEYKKLPLFYEEWDDESSLLLLDMDNELTTLLHKINQFGFPVRQIKPLLEHYESRNYVELTNKLKSINSLKGLTTPSIRNSNKTFSPDFNSRYFTADFPFGLSIIISFCEFFNVECNSLNKVYNWYKSLFKSDSFIDLKKLFLTTDKMKEFYLK